MRFGLVGEGRQSERGGKEMGTPARGLKFAARWQVSISKPSRLAYIALAECFRRRSFLDHS